LFISDLDILDEFDYAIASTYRLNSPIVNDPIIEEFKLEIDNVKIPIKSLGEQIDNQFKLNTILYRKYYWDI